MPTGTILAQIVWNQPIILELDLRPGPQEQTHAWNCKYGQELITEMLKGSEVKQQVLFC